MALVVEDGTGLANADSYTSVADADTYIAAYKSDVTAWDAATDAAKEVAARQATQHLDFSYRWKGERETSTQSLDWPRVYAYDERGLAYDGVPDALKQAESELMYSIINGVSISTTITRKDQVKRKKIDVIETEYVDGATYQTVFPIVNGILSALYIPSGSVIRG